MHIHVPWTTAPFSCWCAVRKLALNPLLTPAPPPLYLAFCAAPCVITLRSSLHRRGADVQETSNRLMWCTLIEAAVLIWVSWSQLSYIRRFFETKRIL